MHIARRVGVLAALSVFLFGSGAQAAYAPVAINAPSMAAYAIPDAAPVSAPDKVRDAVRGGLIHLATVFTNAGAAIVTNRIIQAGTSAKNIGWGIGATAAAVTDTALGTESAPTTAGGRTVGTESRTTITVTNDNLQVAGSVTAGSTLAITEAGLFDAVSAGGMLIRSVFTAVNVTSGDSIAFTFGLKFVPN